MSAYADDPRPRRFRCQAQASSTATTPQNGSPWHTVISSRLGRNLLAHQHAIAAIKQFLFLAAERHDLPCVFAGTAIAPWLQRACQLLSLPYLSIAEKTTESEEPFVFDRNLYCQDRAAVEFTDRIDVIYVRPKGKIMRLLCERLEQDTAPNIHVLISSDRDRCAQELMKRGAVGYWWPSAPSTATVADDAQLPLPGMSTAAGNSLIQQADQWLIHSTRARTGPWPGESWQQFQDGLLLRPPEAVLQREGVLETLQRIVRDQRLVGTPRTVRADQTVVCFTAKPLLDWTSQRTFRAHLGRWDAEPYGVAVRRDFANAQGLQPVIYADATSIPGAEDPQQWLYQAKGRHIDWTTEHEWRVRGVLDLRSASPEQIIVFVKSPHEVLALKDCRWPIIAVEALANSAGLTPSRHDRSSL